MDIWTRYPRIIYVNDLYKVNVNDLCKVFQGMQEFLLYLKAILCVVSKITILKNNKPEFQSLIFVFIERKVLRKLLYLTNFEVPCLSKKAQQ